MFGAASPGQIFPGGSSLVVAGERIVYIAVPGHVHLALPTLRDVVATLPSCALLKGTIPQIGSAEMTLPSGTLVRATFPQLGEVEVQ